MRDFFLPVMMPFGSSAPSIVSEHFSKTRVSGEKGVHTGIGSLLPSVFLHRTIHELFPASSISFSPSLSCHRAERFLQECKSLSFRACLAVASFSLEKHRFQPVYTTRHTWLLALGDEAKVSMCQVKKYAIYS